MAFSPEIEIGFAQNLAESFVARGGNLTALFSAFVGLVHVRDKAVGRDCLVALDLFVSSSDGASNKGTP